MHAALAFLLVLTVHRCYPAGVPRFLQGDLIRRQIRNYSQTLCLLWAFAVLINLPLFAITNYEKTPVNVTIHTENKTNLTYSISEPICFTGATEVWSRTYLILLLVLTYLITGIFLIVIYGQAIRIILASKKYSENPGRTPQASSDQYRYLSPPAIPGDAYRSKVFTRLTVKCKEDIAAAHSSSSSSATVVAVQVSNRRKKSQSRNSTAKPLVLRTPIEQSDLSKSSVNSHSTQHLQVIIMLFIVILLYILLLLPYRLFNLLYIVHNQLFQQSFMNEVLFRWLLNSVRLLVFLNCALQPITYLIISSRLRQTVVKFLRSWYRCSGHCQCSSVPHIQRHYKSDQRAVRAYLTQKHPLDARFQNQQRQTLYRDSRPLQTSLNNLNPISCQGLPINHLLATRSTSPAALSRLTNRSLYTVSFMNGPRK